jgi:hypothetical protein
MMYTSPPTPMPGKFVMFHDVPRVIVLDLT